MISPRALSPSMPRAPRPARHPIPKRQIRLALVRSRVKVRVLLSLARLGPTYAAELAREAHTTIERLNGAMKGDGEAYAKKLSLLRLRLVTKEEDVIGTKFKLTPLGRRVARAWRSKLVTSWVGASSRVPL